MNDRPASLVNLLTYSDTERAYDNCVVFCAADGHWRLCWSVAVWKRKAVTWNICCFTDNKYLVYFRVLLLHYSWSFLHWKTECLLFFYYVIFVHKLDRPIIRKKHIIWLQILSAAKLLKLSHCKSSGLVWQRDRTKFALFSINVQLWLQNHKIAILGYPTAASGAT